MAPRITLYHGVADLAMQALALAAEEPAVALYESVGFCRYARLVELRKER